MLNSANLHESTRHYDVTHQGKHYRCSRVSDVIEHTSATPIAIKMWMVNCAAEEIASKGVKQFDTKDPANANILKAIKSLAWTAHQAKQQQALDIGTRVHGWIKNNAYDEANKCEESKACWIACEAFKAKYLPVPIAQEVCLYDTKNLIAGTTDWIGLLGSYAKKKGKQTIYILDWKSSKQLSHSYSVQIVIYKHMLLSLVKLYQKNPALFDVGTSRIMNDIILAAGKTPKIVCGLVRLNKNPNARKLYEFKELTAKEERHCLKEFKLMIQLYNHRKEQTTWSN